MTEPADWNVKLVDKKQLSELQKDLRGLNLLGLEVGKARDDTDTGADVLESTVTKITKQINTAVSAIGVVSVAGVSTFWHTLNDSVKGLTVLGLGIVLAAVAISLGVLVASDLRSRAAGQVAIYNARAAIATKYMDLIGADGANSSTAAPKKPKLIKDQVTAPDPVSDQTKALFATFAADLLATLIAHLRAQLPHVPSEQSEEPSATSTPASGSGNSGEPGAASGSAEQQPPGGGAPPESQ